MAETEFIPYEGSNASADIDTAIARAALVPSLQTAIESKQDELTTAQLAAVNSGATAENIAAIANKQDELTTAQLAAANSGIDSAKVATLQASAAALANVVDTPGKNLCRSNVVTGQTSSTIVATVNADKTITLTGTAGTSDAAFILFPDTTFPAGTYVLSGCPEGGATAKYRIDLVAGGTVYRDTGSGVTFTLAEPALVRANIAVYRGKAAPETAFKPMICTKAAWDASHAYVPFVEPRKLVVLEVGTGKAYTSLRKALEFATAHYSEDTIYEVRLFSSEYDVANDLTQAELGTSSSYTGLAVTKNVRLVGVNGYRDCVIKLELDSSLDESIRKRLSTLNVKDNAELEGITVSASVCRYAVHDDYYSETDRKKTIRNCRFVGDGTFYHRAYGAGFRSGDDFTFENCIFEQTDPYFAPVSFHNNTGFTKPANLKFVNCRFSGGAYGAQFGSLNTDAVGINTLTFIGCKHDADETAAIRLYEENASLYGAGCMFAVTGFGNSFTGTDVLIQTTDSEDYSDRIDLI